MLTLLFVLLVDATLGCSDLRWQSWLGRDFFESTSVVASTISEASASDVTARVGRDGAEAGLGTEDEQVGGAPTSEAMDVDMMGQD